MPKKKINLQDEHQEKLYKYVKEHYWSVRNFSASTLSSTFRQLALGIGGICLTINIHAQNSCLKKIIIILLVLFFILDASQYLTSLIKYKDLAEDYDRKILSGDITEFENLSEPQHINRLSNIFFILKQCTLFLASFVLIYLLLKS